MRDADSIRLVCFKLLVKESDFEPRIVDLGFRLIVDEEDFDLNLESLKKNHMWMMEMPNTEFEILHEDIGLGYSSYCYDVFSAGKKVLGKKVESITTTNPFINVSLD